jgi:hypothetical protein
VGANQEDLRNRNYAGLNRTPLMGVVAGGALVCVLACLALLMGNVMVFSSKNCDGLGANKGTLSVRLSRGLDEQPR